MSMVTDDSQSVGRLHMGRRAKHEHRHDATRIEREVDRGYIELTAVVGGVLDDHTRPEVKAHGFAENGKRPAEQGLARYDCRTCRHHDAGNDKPVRHNPVERVDGRVDVATAGYHPRALSEIVEYEHDLDKNPAHGYIEAAAVAEVGV